MLFNSYIYLFAFLPTAFLVYFLLNRWGQTLPAKVWLTLCSLFFYGFWNPNYLFLIVGSILVNYTIGLSFQRSDKKKKSLLIIGIIANLFPLAFYKYTDFMITNLNFLGGEFEPLGLILPLAISFFTFQQIAYLVDSYKGIAREYDFISYALFVSFFPQLIAGPIVHHKEMMPQFTGLDSRKIKINNITVGLFILSMGLFKKVVIADSFIPIIHNGFDVAAYLTFFEAWFVTLSYAFQIYFDFSGYTDMAIGSALLFNIKLPQNFNSPYKATSIQDFWRRWHMTLSRWLRDYVYIPLGGSKKRMPRTLANLFLTFIIGGIWHGAGWTFIIWGALHGGAMVIHRLWQKLNINLGVFLSWLITFVFINVTWVFFRALDLESAFKILKGMVRVSDLSALATLAAHPSIGTIKRELLNNIIGYEFLSVIGPAFITAFITALFLRNSIWWAENLKLSWRTAGFFAGLTFMAISNLTRVSEFLYFQF